MPDVPPGFIYPSERQWQSAGERGEHAVRRALAKLGISLTKSGTNATLAVAVGHGALVAIGGYLRVLSGPDNHVAEQWAMATLRGALRGAEGPVRDDGQPFTMATDA
jgi:hypothetical protein